MKTLRFVILGVLVAGAAVRIWLRRRRRTGDSRPAGRNWAWQLPEGRADTLLVAEREIRERLRARAFRVVTVILLAVVAAGIVIPTLSKSHSGPQQIGVVGTIAATVSATMDAAAEALHTTVDVVPEPDAGTAAASLRAKRIDIALIDESQVVTDQPAGSTNTTSSLAQVLAAAVGRDKAYRAAGLSPAQQAAISQAGPLPVVSLHPASAKSSSARGTSVLGIIIVFVMLSQYETWTLIGVMEEKSSRVVEVLLATVKPLQLLGGKVLGIGLVALAQAGLLLGFALALGEAVNSGILKGAAPLMLAAALLWLVVGYAFYCWVYAAAGSMAERQDQIQTLALPLSVPMIVGYILALTTASSGHASPFFQVLAYLPPTAPFAMPILVGLGQTTWYGFFLSVLISVVSTVAVARVAAAIYRRAVLRTGRRVRLREVLSISRGQAGAGTSGAGIST